MRVRNYLKKKCEATVSDNFLLDFIEKKKMLHLFGRKKIAMCFVGIFAITIVTVGAVIQTKFNSVKTADAENIKIAVAPVAATATKTSVISIPSGMVKTNPFLPYRDISGNEKVNDIPAYNLVEPPEMVDVDSDAARVMDTMVSGILFDKFSPSAILNIEGNDYLVKKGDVVNNYKVVNIAQDSVTVKLGANVYKAGIGEILTEGTINHNNVSNLENKFGGER